MVPRDGPVVSAAQRCHVWAPALRISIWCCPVAGIVEQAILLEATVADRLSVDRRPLDVGEPKQGVAWDLPNVAVLLLRPGQNGLDASIISCCTWARSGEISFHLLAGDEVVEADLKGLGPQLSIHPRAALE